MKTGAQWHYHNPVAVQFGPGSFTLPMVLSRALGADPDRDAVLARIFGAPLADSPAVLTRFLEDIGVSTRFSSYGVSDADASRMVDAALQGVRGRNFIGAAASSASHIT